MKQRQSPRKSAPGIVDVARRAGVSTATVSRFFNNPEMVRVETRASIESASRELGYIRDRMAGAMHSQFSGSVGLIVPTINNAIFSGLIEAFANRLIEHDRTMLIACHNYDLDLEVSLVRSLLERRIEGVAIVGEDHRDGLLDILQKRDVPVVALWGHGKRTSIPFIGADNSLAAAKVTRHLLDLGHRDVAFLFPDTHNNDRARERFEGAMDAMAQAGISVPEHRLIDCPYDVASAKSIAVQLLQSNAPTAIVCGNDVIAHGVLYAAMQSAIPVPERLSVVGIGDFAGSEEIYPGLTTVRIPAQQIGKMAADSLVQLILHDAPVPFESQVLETKLVVRGSTSGLS
ncbi:transcriptional regulator [Chromatiales bacterium (ex Bugula neritina AB1)]|nr:transcriptional regulator [Chromatiales bacterium (ex Bugula neritina AB1)]